MLFDAGSFAVSVLCLTRLRRASARCAATCSCCAYGSGTGLTAMCVLQLLAGVEVTSFFMPRPR